MAKENVDDRLAAAKRDLRRLQEEIAPFVKKRDRRRPTTAGQWQNTRDVTRRAKQGEGDPASN